MPVAIPSIRRAAAGTHASTGKPIQALAPAAGSDRFTDAAKVENGSAATVTMCLRECTAAEKANLLAWLMSLTP